MQSAHVANAEETRKFAAEFVGNVTPYANAATVVALSGQLGAGKTTFVQAAAKALGVAETVNSPTFVIEKIYSLEDQTWDRLVHIDAYRLTNAEELRHLGWSELVTDGGNIILIEWPEHVEGAIPEGAHRVSIEIPSTKLGTSGDGDARTITYGG